MNGLDAEFDRFAKICLDGASPDEVANVKRMFFAGALAQADRMLSILDADLPAQRKSALLRRIARECQGFKKRIEAEAKQLDTKEGRK